MVANTFLVKTGLGQLTNPEIEHIEYQGLSKASITCILQDSQGFMWFGSSNILYRYNGYEFTAFLHSKTDSNSLSNNVVVDIIEDGEKNIWIATSGGGLNKYTPSLNIFKRFISEPDKPESLTDNQITSITLDKQGRLWIAYPHDGFSRLNIQDNSFIHYNAATTENKFPDYGIPEIFASSDGKIWFAMYNSKLGYLDINKKANLVPDSAEFKIFHKNNMNDGLAHKGFKRFSENRNGDIIIMSTGKNKSIYRYNRKTSTFDQIFDSLIDFEFDTYLPTGDGGIYVAGKYKMIFIQNDEIQLQFSYKKNNINSWRGFDPDVLYHDRSGVLWIGTIRGLDKYRRKKFVPYQLTQETDSNNITGIVQDMEGNTWLSIWKVGVYRLNKDGSHQLFRSGVGNQGLEAKRVWKLYRDSYNTIWLGTYEEGLYRIVTKNGKVKFLKCRKANFEPFKENCTVVAIEEDENRDLWVGCWYGQSLMRYNRKTNTLEKIWRDDPFNDSLSIGTNIVNAIFTDENNDFWVGTNEGLAKRIQKKQGNILPVYKRYAVVPGKKHWLSNNSINCLFEDSKGNFWIGTKNGLNLMDRTNETFKNYTTSEGLSNNHIVGIEEDDTGTLWISTKDGLTSYNSESGEFTKYLPEDGLIESGYTLNSIYKAQDGKLFFGGEKGYNTFYPGEIHTNTAPPNMVFTGFKIFNKSIAPGKAYKDGRIILDTSITQIRAITLSYKDKIFSVEFAALDYNIPKKHKYVYIMEGFKDEWTEVDADRRFVTYTNLNPGEYTFKVRGTNNDGVWSKTRELHITIIPPFWQTWWFRISAFVFIIGLALSFYFWRVNTLKARQRELEQKVDERTAELKEANTSLEEQKEEIQQQNDEITAANEEIKSSRDQLEKAFNNIKILSEFGQKLTATFDFDHINKMIYDYVVSLVDTAAFGIGIYNEKRDIIDFPYFMENGKPIPYFFKSLSSDRSLSVKCFVNKQEIVISNLSEEYKQYLKELPEVKTSKLPRSVIHLPLIAEGKSIGTLTVNSYGMQAYNEADVNNLRTLASYISIALDNSRAYRQLDRQQEQITGSIRYGQTIQQAILPPDDIMKKYHDTFVLYRPKDIVSGDFYWFTSVETHGRASLQGKPMFFYAVVDCTGHGVPGAFMSMIGSRLLAEIINEMHILNPKDILENLDRMIVKSLRQKETSNHDGMDVSLVRLDKLPDETNKVIYSGAKRPLLYYQNKIHTIEGTRRSIGGLRIDKSKNPFEEKEIILPKDSLLYLSSDGLVDQCNPQRKKFSTKRLIEYLGEMVTLDMDAQDKFLNDKLDEFQGQYVQRDDITFMGIKL